MSIRQRQLIPFALPTKMELAWAAGFYDGEGCTTGVVDTRRLVKPRYVVTLAVSQSTVAGQVVLERFRAAVGGIGKVNGPYGRGNSAKPVYKWQTNGFERTQAVIAMLWPYLSEPKREQATKHLRKFREVHGVH
jgi:hypothetical protein